VSKTPGPISYPNLITDHHPVVKLREMIDGHNALKATTDAHSKILGELGSTIEALPTTYMTAQGTVNQIGMYVSTPTFLTGLNTALTKLGVPVPHPPQQVSAPIQLIQRMRLDTQSEARWITFGTRDEAPTGFGKVDSGFLYFVSDYAHTALWDGMNWQLIDGQGGYFVDAVANPGPGYQLCDGTTTNYLLTNTPNLAYVEYTTPKFHSLRHRTRKYFRR
jgi:hypothetical protein